MAEAKSLFATTPTPSPQPTLGSASATQAVPLSFATTDPFGKLLSSSVSSLFQQNTMQTRESTQQTSSFSVPSILRTATVSDTKPQRDERAIRDALAALAKLGLNVTEADLGKLNPPDEYEDELALMAEVRAYFDVSYKVSPRVRDGTQRRCQF